MVYVLLTQNQKDTKPRSSNGSGFFYACRLSLTALLETRGLFFGLKMANTDPRQWHLEKSVSISHLISTIILFITLAVSWAAVTGRVSVIETKQNIVNTRLAEILSSQRQIDNRQDTNIGALNNEIKQNYLTIDAKLDGINSVIRELARK